MSQSIASLGIKVTTDGVSQAAQQLDKLDASASKVAKDVQAVAPAMDKAKMSAAALANATRQLPAQFTDIATGLATGQKPLQVLLQQGGQLKDVFGGVGPALRASAGYILGLINPLTVAAAAVATLGLAWKQQQDQLDAFNISLARTNNYVGLTADQLQDMAREIDRTSNATIGGASEALNRLVAGGKIAGDQLQGVARASAEWAKVSGDSIDSIAAKFESLAKSPLDALLKLNEAEHFLTREQADRIRSLQEEGRTQEAVADAVRIYTDNLNDATKRAESNLGALSGWWRDVKNATSGAWAEAQEYASLLDRIARNRKDAFPSISGAGRNLLASTGNVASLLPKDWTSNLGTLTNALIKSQLQSAAGPAQRNVQVRMAGIYAPVDSDEYKADQKALADRKKLQEDFARDEFRYLDDKAKKLHDIAEVNDLVTKGIISQADATKRIAQIEASYARKGSKDREKTDYSASLLQSIRQQIDLNKEQAASEGTLTTSQSLRVRILAQLDTLGGKITATQRKEIDAALAQLKVTDEQNQAVQEQLRLKEDVARLNAQLSAAEDNRRRAGEAELLGLTQGSDAAERARRRLDVEKEYQDGLKTLRDRGVAEDSDSWKTQEKLLRESRDRMLQIDQDFYSQRDAIQGDWTNGLKRGLQDYVTYAEDIASRTADVVDGITGALQGTFEEFFRTGKLDWKGFLDDVNAQLARFFSQQLVKQIIQGFGQGASGQQGGGGEGNWLSTIGQVIGSWFGGGRASGGPMSGRKLYEVGERGPEVFESGGRMWMVPGRDGYMHPDVSMAGAGAGGSVSVSQTIVLQGTPNRRTANQIAVETGREMQRASRRT